MSILASLSARATEAGLNFLVAGGHAVIAHGHVRNTFDLDLIVSKGQQEEWIELLDGLRYSCFHRASSFMQFTARDPRTLPLDLMLVNEDTFAKLLTEGSPLPEGLPAGKLVSLRHLLALKCHAIKHGHGGRIVKDADDVIGLVKANRVDLEDPEIRALFRKHGTDELYEKVRRASGPT
jgi:hypothetical protein